jgi:hypothetical protein
MVASSGVSQGCVTRATTINTRRRVLQQPQQQQQQQQQPRRRMKFGKRLLAQIGDSNWVYINYKGLKRQLKKIESFGRNTETLSVEAFRERDNFLDMVFRDIDSIDAFYLKLEENYSKKFSLLLSDVQVLVLNPLFFLPSSFFLSSLFLFLVLLFLFTYFFSPFLNSTTTTTTNNS